MGGLFSGFDWGVTCKKHRKPPDPFLLLLGYYTTNPEEKGETETLRPVRPGGHLSLLLSRPAPGEGAKDEKA